MFRRCNRLPLACALLSACSRLAGIDDIAYVPGDASTETDDGAAPTADGAMPTDAVNDETGDVSPETSTCNLAATAFDDRNCGRCGHDCLGGTCTGGVCQPIFLALQSGDIQGMVASNDGYVYWVDASGAVSRVEKEGLRQPQVIASALAVATDIVVDDVYAYYTIAGDTPSRIGGVNRVFKQGGERAVGIALGFTSPAGIALRGPYVFFANSEPPALLRAAKDALDGSTVIPLYKGQPDDAGNTPFFLGVAADDQYVFVTDAATNAVWRIRQDAQPGDPAELFAPTSYRPVAIRVDGDFVYWADAGYLYRKLGTDPPGKATPLRPATLTRSIALDASDLYYVSLSDISDTARGTIKRIPKDGQSSPTEVSGGWIGLGAIDVDELAVYFVSGNSIVKIAK